MSSSLYGIYNAHRAIMLNQAAMNIVNNNIANINTPGYSKQRLELSAQTLVTDGTETPIMAAQLGLGTAIDDISRNRDVYLDAYFRKENTDLSYYKELKDNCTLVEDITNELNDTGIGNALDAFYASAQRLSQNPTDSISRNDFVQKAVDLNSRFNMTYDRLQRLRTNLVGDVTDSTTLDISKIKITCDDINTQLKTIANLNKTITLSTAQNSTPNGLLDQRDKLVDEISQYLPMVAVNAEGNVVNISIGGTDLVKGASQVGFLDVVTGTALDPATVKIVDENGLDVVANANSLMTSGKIGAILDMGGSDVNKFNVSNIVDSLNTLAKEFAREVNRIHRGGQYIDTTLTPAGLARVTPATSPPDPFDIFVDGSSNPQADYLNLTAGNIAVNQDVIDDPFLIAAATTSAASAETGDGYNALLIAQIRNSKLPNLSTSTTESYLSSMVGKMGIQIKSISDNHESQNTIVTQVDQRRQSAFGVNLDEELTDLIKFQRAFEASAKILNASNEAIQTIMNMVR